MNKILSALKIIFQQSFYRNVAIVVSLAVAYLSYWLLSQTTSIQMFINMTRNGDFGQYSLLYGTTYMITTLLIIGLSGISVAVMLWLFKHSKLSKGKTLGANLGGFAAGMVGMGCPVCGAFLLSLLGVAGGLTLFPLQGLELKFLSLGLLTASTVFGASKVKQTSGDANSPDADNDCDECVVHPVGQTHGIQKKQEEKTPVVLPLQKIFVFILAGIFLLNQLLIGQVAASMGITSQGMGFFPSSSRFIGQLFGV